MQTDACFPLSPFLEANRREGGNTHEQDDRAAQQMLHVHRRAVYAILNYDESYFVGSLGTIVHNLRALMSLTYYPFIN